jgi:hypothetical protein
VLVVCDENEPQLPELAPQPKMHERERDMLPHVADHGPHWPWKRTVSVWIEMRYASGEGFSEQRL